ncbi:MAG: hypothetical protein M3525_15070, partial [Acidobacteriota bacterium]|nr:hypothetical protein [Acidobacteriota bacterium]
MLNPIVIAVPVFALLIAIETFFLLRESRENVDSKDVWTNIFVGLASVFWGALFGLFTSGFYLAAYELA